MNELRVHCFCAAKLSLWHTQLTALALCIVRSRVAVAVALDAATLRDVACDARATLVKGSQLCAPHLLGGELCCARELSAQAPQLSVSSAAKVKATNAERSSKSKRKNKFRCVELQ